MEGCAVRAVDDGREKDGGLTVGEGLHPSASGEAGSTWGTLFDGQTLDPALPPSFYNAPLFSPFSLYRSWYSLRIQDEEFALDRPTKSTLRIGLRLLIQCLCSLSLAAEEIEGGKPLA